MPYALLNRDRRPIVNPDALVLDFKLGRVVPLYIYPERTFIFFVTFTASFFPHPLIRLSCLIYADVGCGEPVIDSYLSHFDFLQSPFQFGIESTEGP